MTAGVAATKRLAVSQAIDELDLGTLGRALWRRRTIIIGLTLAVSALTFLAVNLITPRYKSEARVLIETRDNIFLRPEADKATERNATVDQEAVTSQVQLILSRDLARDVIKKLKLGERPEFDPVLRGSSIVRVLMGVVGLAKDPMSQTPEERVLKSYGERLTAYQVEKSRVIAIEFESEDPELASRAANAVAEGYIALQQNAKQEQSRAAGTWLADKIETMRKAVAESEAKVEQYRGKTNLFMGTNNTTLSNQQLGELNAQLSAARAQKSDAEAKSRIIRDALRAGASIEFSDIVNSELIRRLSEQRVTLRAQLAEQSSTLLDQHPRIKELKAQIGDLERQMRLEADRQARAFENDSKLADAKAESLSKSLDQLKRQAVGTNEQDVQLRALERDAKSQRDLLESYLAKYREATARDSIGAASPDARIISTAFVTNTPSWPKKLPTVLIAALGTLALSVGFVLSGELLGATAAPPATEVEERPETKVPEPDLRSLGTLDARASAGLPLAALDDLARELRTAGEDGRRIVVVGSSASGAERPLAAITLARSLVKEARVVLVDLALVAPSFQIIAVDPFILGISELVHGQASFGQVITRDRYSRVHVVMAGASAGDAAAIIGSQRLSITLEALARSYDHVVVDAGPLADATPERLARFASRAVLVVDRADNPSAAAANATLLAAGFANVTVLASEPAAADDADKRAAA